MDQAGTLTLKLEEIDAQGEAAAHHEGRKISVFGGLPDEDVQAATIYKNRNLWAARVTDLTNPSPNRIEPPCPYFGDCTGCQWQHIKYPYQLELKRQLVVQALREKGIEVFVSPAIPSPQEFGYRNHARFTVNKNGSLGFINRRSRRFVKVERCLIMHKEINEMLAKLQGHCGETTQLSIRCGVNSRNYLIQPSLKAEDVSVVTGQKYYDDTLLGLAFRISAASFFQVNIPQTENMVNLVRKCLGLSGKELLVDAYTGVGTFAVLLASHARGVVAIEESNSAIKDAGTHNEIPNLHFIEAKTEEAIHDLRPDALILDPPRVGCHPGVIAALNSNPPQKIVYISCEPQALANDLNALLHGPFTLDGVKPVDLFPQTYHVECLATLSYDATKKKAFKVRQKLILASASPRRHQILNELNIQFDAAAPVEDLNIDVKSPVSFSIAQASHKARTAASHYKDGTVIAADTIVVDDEGILGKPSSPEEAIQFLKRLNGKRHRVITAMSLIDAATGEEVSGWRSSGVQMRSMSDREISQYVASGSPLDKAGAYGIQDDFKPIREVGGGCDNNVVGLPVCLLLELMLKLGVHPDYNRSFPASHRCRDCRKWFNEPKDKLPSKLAAPPK